MARSFPENITKYFTHAQTVCTRPLLRGGGGGGGGWPGEEARVNTAHEKVGVDGAHLLVDA